MKPQFLANSLYLRREGGSPELEMEAPRSTMQQALRSSLKTFYAMKQCEARKTSQLSF